VGDYISTSYVNGKAFPVIAVAGKLVGTKFNEAMFTVASGLSAAEGEPTFSSAGDEPVPGAQSDHGPRRPRDERGVKLPPAQ
jgi:hypothetical protein